MERKSSTLALLMFMFAIVENICDTLVGLSIGLFISLGNTNISRVNKSLDVERK